MTRRVDPRDVEVLPAALVGGRFAGARALARLILVAVALQAGCAPSEGPARDSQPIRPDSRVEPELVAPPKTSFDGRIRLASIFPHVGRYALSGIQSTHGARMAVEDLNRRGGVHGRQLELLEYRTGSYFLDAQRAAELAIDAGAVALIGSNSSSLSMAVATLAEERGIVQVSNVSTAQDLTWDPETGLVRRFVFRVCGSDVVMGARLAEFARDELEARRVAVLYEIGREYSAKLARSFIDRFEQPSAGRVTAQLSYLPLETDFQSQLAAVAAFDADVLFVPGSFTDATLIAIQAEDMQLRPTLLGADGWSNPLLFSRGGPTRPAFFSDHCFPPETFNARYRREFGEPPHGCRAVLAYDAVMAVVGALDEIGPLTDEQLRELLTQTRERLRAALAASGLNGESGRIRFDEHGDGRRGVAIVEVVRRARGLYETSLHGWLGDR